MSDRIRKLIAEHDKAYGALKALPPDAGTDLRFDAALQEDLARGRAATALGVSEPEYMNGREIGIWRSGPQRPKIYPRAYPDEARPKWTPDGDSRFPMVPRRREDQGT